MLVILNRLAYVFINKLKSQIRSTKFLSPILLLVDDEDEDDEDDDND